jgi:DNA-binding transcriptional MerR regulator
MSYKVKEVSKLVSVSVRTLHHYDEIGLLNPEFVTTAGYRLYSDTDLERLQQILFFKELDFTLQEIKDILDSPGFDREKALSAHRNLLVEKKKRLERLIQSLDKTMEAIEGGLEMNKKEMFDGFDMTEIERHKERYAEEAKEKYGKGDAYKESMKKTSRYGKEDWARITAESEAINNRIIANMDKGIDDPTVQQGVAQLRQHITDNYYNCTVEIFRGLGDLYVADERFTANIDKNKPGYAIFLREAMHYYCDKVRE